jgi:hypothetical protein
MVLLTNDGRLQKARDDVLEPNIHLMIGGAWMIASKRFSRTVALSLSEILGRSPGTSITINHIH